MKLVSHTFAQLIWSSWHRSSSGDRPTTVARHYWCNQATGLANDAPGEADLAPDLWGEVKLE